MKTITSTELDRICNNGKAIDMKGGYPAVVIHPNDTITKLWARKKGFFSSATFDPYSNRFVRNADELAKRDIIVPKILNHFRLEKSHIQLVTYTSLPGQSIRELIHSEPNKIDLATLSSYINSLHQKGILFGGMHLGNIIQMENGYGLIDFTDVRFYKRPLSDKQRASNLRVPLRYQEDISAMEKAGLPNLIDTYLAASDLDAASQQKIRDLIRH